MIKSQKNLLKKFLNLNLYFSKIIFWINNLLLSRIERLFSFNKELKYSPIFIVGAPRSGSTLLMQLIIQSFDVGYFTNLHNLLFGFPALIDYFFNCRKYLKKSKNKFSSFHGTTKNLFGVSENFKWWYRFFKIYPTYTSLQDLDKRSMSNFRISVTSMINVAKKPFLFKNLYSSFRLLPICDTLPESLFIFITRDELQNAHSLLKCRIDTFHNYDEWFSLEPRNINDLKKLKPHEQVIEQVREINKTIKMDFKNSKISKRKIFSVSYEELCDRPFEVIEKLEAFFKENNCKIKKIKKFKKKFRTNKKILIDKDLFNKLVDYKKNS